MNVINHVSIKSSERAHARFDHRIGTRARSLKPGKRMATLDLITLSIAPVRPDIAKPTAHFLRACIAQYPNEFQGY